MKIAVVGKMRSGKDTVAHYFIKNNNCFKLALADGIVKAVRTYFPETLEKGKPRKILQKIGQDFREIDKDVWVKYLDRQMKALEERGITSFIVTDVRQPNEYEYLKLQGFTVIRVDAADEIRIERIHASGDVMVEEDFNHITEISAGSIPYDYLITNNTTLEDLLIQCEYVFNAIKSEVAANE